MFQSIVSRLFVLAAPVLIVASTGFAQGLGNRVVVTFSDGQACAANATPPVFNALSATVNATSTTNFSGGASGMAVGRPKFDDVVITRNVDDCSVSLFALLIQGRFIKTVVLSYQAASSTGVYKETLRMTLADAAIAGLTDATVAGAPSTEKVTLAFRTITIFDPDTGKSTQF